MPPGTKRSCLYCKAGKLACSLNGGKRQTSVVESAVLSKDPIIESKTVKGAASKKDSSLKGEKNKMTPGPRPASPKLTPTGTSETGPVGTSRMADVKKSREEGGNNDAEGARTVSGFPFYMLNNPL